MFVVRTIIVARPQLATHQTVLVEVLQFAIRSSLSAGSGREKSNEDEAPKIGWWNWIAQMA